MSLYSSWDNFWFRSIDARQFAALRIVFGLFSVIYLCQLLPYVTSQFSDSGWLGTTRQIAEQSGGSWSLLFLTVGAYIPLFAYVFVGIGILSAALLMIGWHSKIAAFICWLVWVSLWNRNPLLFDGDDAILKIMCWYLMLSPCGNCWSVDTKLQKRPQFVAVWPLRLVQFQIALIYFVSGWVKFYSLDWQSGDVIQYVLIHPHYSRWDGWAFSSEAAIPEIFAGLADFIKWWEVLFPLALIHPLSRKLSLLIGLMFHLGLFLTMNLRWFPIIMLALYLALISNCLFKMLEEALYNLLSSLKHKNKGEYT